MSKVILDVNNLSKKFKNFTAVDNISFNYIVVKFSVF